MTKYRTPISEKNLLFRKTLCLGNSAGTIGDPEMTIAVVGNFSEGIVLGVDSAVTHMNSKGDVNAVYEAAQKIYHIGRESNHSDSPFAAMLFGATHFGLASWRNVFANFWNGLKNKNPDKMEEFIDKFMKYLGSEIPSESKRSVTGLFLAGYGKTDHAPRCFKIDVKPLKAVEILSGDLHWDGMPGVLQNLIKGIDEKTAGVLEKRYQSIQIEVKEGSKKKLVPLSGDIIKTIQRNATTCGVEMKMPLRDAIDYIHFLVYSTVKHYKFTLGPPVCGGQVEIAIVTLDRGFRRILTKDLSSEL